MWGTWTWQSYRAKTPSSTSEIPFSGCRSWSSWGWQCSSVVELLSGILQGPGFSMERHRLPPMRALYYNASFLDLIAYIWFPTTGLPLFLSLSLSLIKPRQKQSKSHIPKVWFQAWEHLHQKKYKLTGTGKHLYPSPEETETGGLVRFKDQPGLNEFLPRVQTKT